MKYTIGIVIGAIIIIGSWYVLTDRQTPETETQTVEQRLSITTSFYPLQFALEQIVGDFGKITNIGEGRDPHNFEPSIQDMIALQKSNLVVLQGADFEPWGDNVIDRLKADNISVMVATANLTLREGGHHHDEDEHEEESDEHEEDEDKHGSYDPHTWLDPILFSQTVDNLTNEIMTLDRDNATIYQENADSLKSELATLDNEYKNRLANCELDEVITSHDAFGYLADRYNFKVHSIAGLSTQDTPSATTLANLKKEAEEGIGAILLEENSISAYGETLARETGLETLSINPIAYLIPAGQNYLTLMRANLDTLVIALKCNE